MNLPGPLARTVIVVVLEALSVAFVPEAKAENPGAALSPPLAAMLEEATKLYREGKYPQAVGVYQLLLDPRASLTIELRAYMMTQIAAANLERGMYGDAVSESREAVAILRQAQKEHTGVFAKAERVRADALFAEGYLEQAERIANDALSLGRETLDTRSPDFAFILVILGRIAKERGKFGQAEHLCQSGLDILRRTDTAQKADVATAYQNVATIQAMRGHAKQALATVDQSLAIWSEVPPAEHPAIVYAMATKLNSYAKLKAFQQGEELVPRVLALAESSLGHDHPERVVLLNNVAIFYIAERKYHDAELLLREAVDIAQHRLPPGHLITRSTLLNYSYVLAKLNRNDEAASARAQSEVVRASFSRDALINRSAAVPYERRQPQ